MMFSFCSPFRVVRMSVIIRKVQSMMMIDDE